MSQYAELQQQEPVLKLLRGIARGDDAGGCGWLNVATLVHKKTWIFGISGFQFLGLISPRQPTYWYKACCTNHL